MSLSRSGNIRLRYWIPLLAWLIAIFYFSTDSFSAQQSSRFFVPILTFFFPGISEPELLFWHGVVRKLSHVGEYFVLAILAHRAFQGGRPDVAGARLFAAILVPVVALGDEFSQSLTISRSSSFFDVGYDCVGGIAALLVLSSARHEIRTIHSHSVL